MNKPVLISVAIAAMCAAVVAQAQTAAQPATQPAGQAAAERPRVSPEAIIALNDANKDGVVTKEEAIRANNNLILMWAGYDMDHDDKVDAAEITRATQDMFLGTALERINGDRGGHMALNDPATTIANNDQNGDGIVTREEATKADKALIKMWNSFDLDKDGKVDAAEIRKAQPY